MDLQSENLWKTYYDIDTVVSTAVKRWCRDANGKFVDEYDRVHALLASSDRPLQIWLQGPFTVVIMTDMNAQVVAVGMSKANPKEMWDETIGVQLALFRCIQRYLNFYGTADVLRM